MPRASCGAFRSILAALALAPATALLDPFRCATNLDCQLNGACDAKTGACVCDIAWRGERCHELALLPAEMSAGLQDPHLSTWGGSVLHNATDGTWHMYAAVIENECGLSSWRPNSAIGYANATSPTGPFTLQRIIKPHFAHEPVALRTPEGLVAIWHIGAGAGEVGPTSNYAWNCTNHCTGHGTHKHAGGTTFYGPTSIIAAATFDATEWEASELDIGIGSHLEGCSTCGDTNPAPMLLAGGGVKMMWRTTSISANDIERHACPGHSCMAMADAPAWSGPYDWSAGQGAARIGANVFPAQGPGSSGKTHVEDAHMWQTATTSTSAANPGSFHAIFHSDVEADSKGAAGGHAWSADGVTWAFSPLNAFTSVVQLANGSNVTLRQRERLHLVFDEAGAIVALTNGVGLLNDCDRVFTFAQAVQQK